MRTTLNINAISLEAARQLVTHRAQSLGKVVSELILKGLQANVNATVTTKAGFPVFAAAAGSKHLTLDDVKHVEDHE